MRNNKMCRLSCSIATGLNRCCPGPQRSLSIGELPDKESINTSNKDSFEQHHQLLTQGLGMYLRKFQWTGALVSESYC